MQVNIGDIVIINTNKKKVQEYFGHVGKVVNGGNGYYTIHVFSNLDQDIHIKLRQWDFSPCNEFNTDHQVRNAAINLLRIKYKC